MPLCLDEGTEILQLTIFVNCEMFLFILRNRNLAVKHFSLTAKFLSIYFKEYILALNHFSLTA